MKTINYEDISCDSYDYTEKLSQDDDELHCDVVSVLKLDNNSVATSKSSTITSLSESQEITQLKIENRMLKQQVARLENLLQSSDRMLQASNKIIENLSANSNQSSLCTSANPTSGRKEDIQENKEHFGFLGKKMVENYVSIILQ